MKGPVAVVYILRLVSYYRTGSWLVVYCLLCFSTSSTSTCTLQYAFYLCFVHFTYNFIACLLYLSFAFALYVAYRRDSPDKVHFAGKYRDLGFRSLAWTIRLDGAISATSISSFPIHPGSQSRLLGPKCMGFGDSHRSCTSSTYAFARISFVRFSALISYV